MEFSNFIKLIKKKRGTIFALVFIIVILTLGVSLLYPLKYEAKSRLLVVQNTIGNSPYAISKSNEYLGNLFAQVVYSGSFYNMVLNSPYDINKNYFSGDYSKQMKIWNSTVSTRTLADTGIIEVKIYHPNPYQAQEIALAVDNILINKNGDYQGNGSEIKINVIDQPLVSTYPVKPNILQNIIIALAASLLFSLFYIYLFPEERYSLKLWSNRTTHRSKKNKKSSKHKIKIDYYPIDPPENLPIDIPENTINDISPTTNYPKNNPDPVEFHPRGNMTNILK